MGFFFAAGFARANKGARGNTTRWWTRKGKELTRDQIADGYLAE